jgi:hypothetical protein
VVRGVLRCSLNFRNAHARPGDARTVAGRQEIEKMPRPPSPTIARRRYIASKPLRDSNDYPRRTATQRCEIIVCPCGQPERVFVSKYGRLPSLCDHCRKHGRNEGGIIVATWPRISLDDGTVSFGPGAA